MFFSQWLFLLEGVPALLLGTAILSFLAQSPLEAKFLDQGEREWLLKRYGFLIIHGLWWVKSLCLQTCCMHSAYLVLEKPILGPHHILLTMANAFLSGNDSTKWSKLGPWALWYDKKRCRAPFCNADLSPRGFQMVAKPKQALASLCRNLPINTRWMLHQHSTMWFRLDRKIRRNLVHKVSTAGGADSQGTEDEGSQFQTFITMVKEWRIWWLAAIWAIVSYGMDGLVFWIPLPHPVSSH